MSDELRPGAVWLLVLTLTIGGCQRSPVAPKDDSPPTPLAARFDEKQTGAIRGQVAWIGAPPKIDPIKIPVATPHSPGDQPNPNAPTIDPKTQAIAKALVFLRAVDAERSRPWPHEPVHVAFEKTGLEIRQGKRPVRIGIVRRGDEVGFVSHDKRNHVLEARGASVFSLPLVEPETVTIRKLGPAGLLELSSGNAYYWMRGHLWIGDHPYATLTDDAGRFELAAVPAGEWEVICWLPNWHVKRRERNPESGDVERLVFEPGVERSAKTTVRAKVDATVNFEWREADFK